MSYNASFCPPYDSPTGIFVFSKKCSFLSEFPLSMMALIIFLYGIILPMAMAWSFQEEGHKTVISISRSWRQTYNYFFLAAALFQIILLYYAVCVFDVVFAMLLMVGLILGLCIFYFNPENPGWRQRLHQTFAGLLFIYLLVLQILLFTSGTFDVYSSEFICFIGSCLSAFGMIITIVGHSIPKYRDWNMHTSMFEIFYIVFTIAVFASVPSSTLC